MLLCQLSQCHKFQSRCRYNLADILEDIHQYHQVEGSCLKRTPNNSICYHLYKENTLHDKRYILQRHHRTHHHKHKYCLQVGHLVYRADNRWGQHFYTEYIALFHKQCTGLHHKYMSHLAHYRRHYRTNSQHPQRTSCKHSYLDWEQSQSHNHCL